MTPAQIALMILQYGLPFAQKIDQIIQRGTPFTADDWATLNALAAQTARSKMLTALQGAGVDPASAQGQALLALT